MRRAPPTVVAVLLLAVAGSARAQPCVEIEERLVRGAFLCGIEGEVRVRIENRCDVAVRCVLVLHDDGHDARREEVVVPWRGTFGSLLADAPRGARACVDRHERGAIEDRAVSVQCEPAGAGASPPRTTPTDAGVSPPRALVQEPAPITVARGTTAAGASIDARTITIALAERDDAYRGPSWHVRWGIGLGGEVVPVWVGRSRFDGEMLVLDASVAQAPTIALVTRLDVEPYAGDVLSIGAFLEGSIGGLSVDGAIAIGLAGRVGLSAALGYRYVFLLLEGSIGGRAVGRAEAIDPGALTVGGGYGAYGVARAGTGVRVCFGLDTPGGCVAGIDLRIALEDLALADAPWRARDPVVVAGASIWITGVGTLIGELAWAMPAAGEPVEAPISPDGSLWGSIRLQRSFEWFGRAYEVPRIACEPGSLTGLWETRDGRALVVEQHGDDLVVRSARGESRGVVSGEITPGARVRIAWGTGLEEEDRGAELDVVGASALAQDGVVVLRRACD